ncbi:hypothetical protein GCM10020358_08790 [Amorphoplanes nipponensis]|uniref:DUF1616 domain-containing protein n=1 Tax=Actinoplanes nipponensis TaxID=135950 RepID=A0A919ML86_9ACTN|nr:DUF1616 domain-containing protein [Actinoplanes nipponensis]GIE48517.1 hypothetical protein Ani05nite_20510 [Actinoplanes nipponensis]
MSALLSRVLAALALAAGAAVLAGPRPAAIAGGLLLGFVLPGMALLGVLFRRRSLTAVERTVLTPALSMGVLIVAGLVVHGVGLRIDRLAWTVSTVGVTLAAVVAARMMRRRTPVAAGPAPRRPVGEKLVRMEVEENTLRLPAPGVAEASTIVMSIVPVVPPAEDEQRAAAEDRARRRRLLRQFLPLVLVAGVLAGASWLSFTTSRATHDTVVTALAAAPSGPVDAAGNRAVRVSASGLLAADGPYTVRVAGPSGTTTLQRTVTVSGDGAWSETLSLPGAQRLTVNLYRAGDTTAYRTLYVSAVD